jgi:hypothetical protein
MAGEVETSPVGIYLPLYMVKLCSVNVKAMTVFSTPINFDGILGFLVSTGYHCLLFWALEDIEHLISHTYNIFTGSFNRARTYIVYIQLCAGPHCLWPHV